MKKSQEIVRKQLKNVRHNSHAKTLLNVLRATGLFRWERPATHGEQVLNILTHGIGIGLAIAGLCLLVVFATLYQDPWAIVSCSIFGLTMFTLYFGSTMCHAMIGSKSECFFEVWDSIAIYALIAGTYTPFLLVNLRGGLGWSIFGVLWAVVIFGSVMKFKNPHQQPKWTVALYLIMGWCAVGILPIMIQKIPARGMWFMMAGACAYSLGVIFYLWRKMRYSHALWHLFVIGGSVCFFFAVLFGCIIDYVG